jgi:hypothetical protein
MAKCAWLSRVIQSKVLWAIFAASHLAQIVCKVVIKVVRMAPHNFTRPSLLHRLTRSSVSQAVVPNLPARIVLLRSTALEVRRRTRWCGLAVTGVSQSGARCSGRIRLARLQGAHGHGRRRKYVCDTHLFKCSGVTYILHILRPTVMGLCEPGCSYSFRGQCGYSYRPDSAHSLE